MYCEGNQIKSNLPSLICLWMKCLVEAIKAGFKQLLKYNFKSPRNAFSCNLEKKSSCNDAYLIYYDKKEWYSGRICLFHCCFRSLFLSYSYKLKAHFQPWCNSRRDPISCNTKFPDHWKPSKIVFLKSHPEHIVNSFTVNTFAVRYFTVSLQYFEFCLEES